MIMNMKTFFTENGTKSTGAVKSSESVKKIISAFVLSFLMLLGFSGCSSNLVLKAQKDLSSTVNLELHTGESLNSILKALFGSENLSVIMNTAEIKQALEGNDFYNVSAEVNSSAFELSGTIAASSNQNSSTQKGLMLKDFVECTPSSLTLTVNPEKLLSLYASLPQESAYLIDLFIAPVFTGEEMTEEEYVELIQAFYGESVASELQNAKLNVVLCSPSDKKIQKSFELPVLELLCLSEEKEFTISW